MTGTKRKQPVMETENVLTGKMELNEWGLVLWNELMICCTASVANSLSNCEEWEQRKVNQGTSGIRSFTPLSERVIISRVFGVTVSKRKNSPSLTPKNMEER